MQEVVTEFGCVAITVDYRLAPETPFPGSLNDNYAALLWLHRNAPELGVDRDRIILAGESAGGGHAAMLAIAARDRGEVPLRAQILTYPMLDDRTGSSRPVPPYIGAFIWQPEDNRFGWSSLLGQPAGSETVPSGPVPARVTDLQELPATFIGVGSIDLFAEEGVEYARRLVDAGVSAELYLAPGAVHGFDSFAPRAEVSTVFRAARDGAIRRAFSA
jgi:acetyl esterase/lipase